MAHLNRKIGIPSFDMTGKTAIITGGTQGLGFGIVLFRRQHIPFESRCQILRDAQAVLVAAAQQHLRAGIAVRGQGLQQAQEPQRVRQAPRQRERELREPPRPAGRRCPHRVCR